MKPLVQKIDSLSTVLETRALKVTKAQWYSTLTEETLGIMFSSVSHYSPNLQQPQIGALQ